MALVRIGRCAVDLDDISGVFPLLTLPPDADNPAMNVFLRGCESVRVEGDDAREFARFVGELPPWSPSGGSPPRVVISGPGIAPGCGQDVEAG